MDTKSPTDGAHVRSAERVSVRAKPESDLPTRGSTGLSLPPVSRTFSPGCSCSRSMLA